MLAHCARHAVAQLAHATLEASYSHTPLTLSHTPSEGYETKVLPTQ